MRNLLKSQHKGIGGLYFITVNIICSLIMVIALKLSWDSQAVAMADNLAYIASINTTVHSYIGNLGQYQLTNPSIPIKSGGTYNPLADFNEMLKKSGISASGTTSCEVVWTGNKTYIQFGEFTTSLSTKVRPHRQESVIEDY